MKPVNYRDNRANQLPRQNFNNIDQHKVKQRHKKVNIMIALSSVIVIFLLIFCVAYFLGYIPIGLSVMEPIGNAKTVNVENLIDDFPTMAEMPNLDKLEYKAFDTDASVSDIVNNYHSRLISDGYSQEYSGTVELDGVTFQVYGYLKGLTAVGILTTDEIIEEYDSLVLYATGNALGFREILDWYQSN